MKKILEIMWSILFFVCSIPAIAHTHDTQAAPPQTESLFNITDTWTTSDGKPFHLDDLKGGPSVIAMIYTSCKDVCPLTVEDMKRIERSLPTTLSKKVHFAVFSFDPDRDTTDKLKKYAISHGIDSSRWFVTNSSADAVRRLAVALGVKYKKNKAGDFEHSTLISILDGSGVVKYQQSNIGQSEEKAILVLKGMSH